MTSIVFPLAVFGAQIESRVIFKKGKTLAVFSGKLPRNYADYDAYVLRARKGQTLTVKLNAADPNASITIYETKEFGPDEDMISPANKNLRQFTGKPPITSEYSVQVYGVDSSDAPSSSVAAYTIQITLR